MIEWAFIAVLAILGWGGFQLWGNEYVENICLERNMTLLVEMREGPLQVCR